MKITTQYTHTAEGDIPHLELFTDVGIIRAPVKLCKQRRYVGGEKVCRPLRSATGALIYALPGGGEFVKEETTS